MNKDRLSELLRSSDYRDRFKGEYYELMTRTRKLDRTIKLYKVGELEFKPTCEIELLEEQLFYMKRYLSILTRRAARENIDVSFGEEASNNEINSNTHGDVQD